MEWLTVTEVSRRIHVSDRTLRRYIHEHKMFIDTRKEPGRPLEIHEKSIEILKQIRTMYEKGWDSTRIQRRLAEIKPMIIPVEDKKEDLPDTVGETLLEFKNMLFEVIERQERLEQQLKDIKEQQQLQTHGIVRIGEELSRAEKYKKKGIFSRFFGK